MEPTDTTAIDPAVMEAARAQVLREMRSRGGRNAQAALTPEEKSERGKLLARIKKEKKTAQ